MITTGHCQTGAVALPLDLQRTNAFQAALLGMAGHDLRQPLQVIRLTYERLGTGVRPESDRELLELGERAVERLTEQLNRLAGAIHLYEHARHLEIASVALMPLFWNVVQENEHGARQKRVKVDVSFTGATVISNAVLLNGILRNLVSNAVKYTEPGGRVLVGCRRRGSDVRIDVCDTGIGITPEQLPRIFDAFKRLDASRCDGLGLGLFIVRRAIEVLGHRVDVSSTVSKGSRFSVFATRAPQSAGTQV
jgi:signal transduction histidine kinase